MVGAGSLFMSQYVSEDSFLESVLPQWALGVKHRWSVFCDKYFYPLSSLIGPSSRALKHF